MSFLDITLPNALGYAAVGGMFISALAHRLEARARSREFSPQNLDRENRELFPPILRKAAGERLSDAEVRAWQQTVQSRHHRSKLSPAGNLLARLLRQPERATDEMAIAALTHEVLSESIGSLRMRIQRLYTTAPAVGFFGTLLGMFLGGLSFAEHKDQSLMLYNVALALLTSLGANAVTVFEGWTLKTHVDPLHERLAARCLLSASMARTLLPPANGRSTNADARISQTCRAIKHELYAQRKLLGALVESCCQGQSPAHPESAVPVERCTGDQEVVAAPAGANAVTSPRLKSADGQADPAARPEWSSGWPGRAFAGQERTGAA